MLIAAGTAGARFAREVGEPVPHQAVGGYHIMLRNPGITLDRPILPMDFRFAIPPMSGAIRLAGIYEFGGEAQPVRQDLVNSLLAHVGKVLPGISTADTTVWRGFRSYLPDGLPVLSGSARVENLYYMFGVSSSGMINGPAAAQAMGALVSGHCLASTCRPLPCRGSRTQHVSSDPVAHPAIRSRVCTCEGPGSQIEFGRTGRGQGRGHEPGRRRLARACRDEQARPSLDQRSDRTDEPRDTSRCSARSAWFQPWTKVAERISALRSHLQDPGIREIPPARQT